MEVFHRCAIKYFKCSLWRQSALNLNCFYVMGSYIPQPTMFSLTKRYETHIFNLKKKYN